MGLLPSALALRLLFEKQGLQSFTNPGKCCIQPFALIDHTDVSLDGSGIAGAREELIAGEASLHLGIHFAPLLQDEAADVEFQYGIANPGVFAQALGEIEIWGGCHELGIQSEH